MPPADGLLAETPAGRGARCAEGRTPWTESNELGYDADDDNGVRCNISQHCVTVYTDQMFSQYHTCSQHNYSTPL